MFAAIWGSPIIIDDKVYLGDEDGDVTVLQHGKELKVVAEQNMGSSVYATAVPANGKLFVMNRNQLWALEEGATLKANRAAGAVECDRRHVSRASLGALLAAAAARAARISRRPRRRAPADAWPQFRGTPSLTGVSAATLPADARSACGSWEGGEVDRLVPGDRRRRRLRRHRHRRARRACAGRRHAPLALQGRRIDRRVVAGASPADASSSAISTAPFTRSMSPTAKPCGRYKTRSEIKSSPIVAGDARAHRLVRRRPVRLRRRRRQAALDRRRPTTTCTARRAIVDGVAYFAGCDEIFHAVRVRDGRQVFAASATAYTGASVAMADGDGVLRHVRQSGDRLRPEDASACCGATSIPIASFPFYSSAALADGARGARRAAIAWCTRSTWPPARRDGPT